MRCRRTANHGSRAWPSEQVGARVDKEVAPTPSPARQFVGLLGLHDSAPPNLFSKLHPIAPVCAAPAHARGRPVRCIAALESRHRNLDSADRPRWPVPAPRHVLTIAESLAIAPKRAGGNRPSAGLATAPRCRDLSLLQHQRIARIEPREISNCSLPPSGCSIMSAVPRLAVCDF